MKSKVAVMRVDPERVLDPNRAACATLLGCKQAIAPASTTILKDNISWHFPFPAANTTPWQLEGTIRALHGAGLQDLVCVQNQTVVTDAFKGEDLNHYLPILKSYGVPVRYNFRPSDMTWVPFTPKAEAARARQDLSRGHSRPRLLLREEHRPPPDRQVSHLHHDDRRDEERLRRTPSQPPALHPLVDPSHARRSSGHSEGDPHGRLRGDGRHDRGERPGAAHDVPGGQERRCSRRRTRRRSTPSPRS